MLKKPSYIKATAISIFALATQVILGLSVIALLAKFLPKDQFGHFIIALTAVQIAASILSASVERTTLFIVSRSLSSRIVVKGELIVAALLIGITGTLLAYIALPILLYSLSEAQEWMFWVAGLIPLILATPIRATIGACLRAEQHTTAYAILEYAIPSIIRLLGVLLIIFKILPSTPIIVSIIFVLAATFPIIIGWPLVSPSLRWPLNIMNKETIKYGFTVMLTKATSEPNKTLDVLLVGFLTSPTVSADYGLASRISNALSLVKQAIDSLLVPRIGSLHASDKKERLLLEYGRARDAGFAAVLFASIVFCLTGPLLLSLLGDYQKAYSIVLLLLAAAVVRIGVGSSGNYLNMINRPEMNLIATVLGITSLISVALLLVPSWGATGGALSVIIAQVIMNGTAVLLAKFSDNVTLVSPTTLLSIISSSIILTLTAFKWLPSSVSALSLLLVALFLVIPHLRIFLKKPKTGENT